MEKEKVITADTANNYRAATKALSSTDKSGKALLANIRQTNGQAKQMAINMGNGETHLKTIETSANKVRVAQNKVNTATIQHNQALQNTLSLLNNVTNKAMSYGG